jgi:phosphoribosylformylglycinamidine synthase
MTTTVQITPEIIEEHGLTPQEYEAIQNFLGREPTITELGVFSVMWSEHCSYKHSRQHLKTLPTQMPCVLHGPGENAGAIDLGNGLACVFKIESHNHPSAVEPYQGAATGVGGILRDIFAMGARPVALFDALRFGPPSNPKNRWIINGVIAGIAEYGNCVGVPTVGGEFSIDPCYSDNCLVNVMAIGMARHEELMTAQARTPGALMIYYGNATGRDGVHGATFASADLSEENAESRSCVQVGDPFMEKKIMEATLELIASGKIEALQDMGAAGLTCSSTEMASKGQLGAYLDLDKVPKRAANLSAYELLLSESQERMLAVVREENLPDVEAILNRWDLDACVVGKMTDTGRFVVDYQGVTEADIPLPAICDEVPPPEPVEREEYHVETTPWQELIQTGSDSEHYKIAANDKDKCWKWLLLDALGSPHFSSKRWIYEQYDHEVQTNTVVKPGHGAAVIRVDGSPSFLAATCDGNGLWCELDPYHGTMALVAEASRHLIACGARSLAVTNNLNFGNPRKARGSHQFAESVRGLGEACRHLGTPVTGGNVSLYNESPRMSVFPTPVIGMVGMIDRPEHLTPGSFQREGDLIAILGPTASHAGGSRILRDQTGELPGPSLQLDWPMELAAQQAARDLIQAGLVHSAKNITDGGLLMALAEMALTSPDDLGCSLYHVDDPIAMFLSEEPSRFVITFSVSAEKQIRHLLHPILEKTPDLELQLIGNVTSDTFEMQNNFSLTVSEMRQAWEKGL